MSEVLLPPWIIPEEESHEWLDEGSSVFRAAFAPGLSQRQSYGGLRLKLSRRHTVRDDEKAQLLSVLNATRGSYNVIRTKVHFATRGSFPVAESFSNNTFSDGTTGWSSSAEHSLSVNDRVIRSIRIAAGTNLPFIGNQSAVTATQYSPYAFRSMIRLGRGAFPGGYRLSFGTTSLATDIQRSGAVTTFGLTTDTYVAQSTSIFACVEDNNATGIIAGEYADFPYLSLSRCAIVDNGPNFLLYSDEFDNAAWTKTRSSAPANGATSPDGTVTAENIVEDSTASSSHFVEQSITISSSVSDYSFTVALKAGARTFAAIEMATATGASSVFVDLSSGAVSNAGSSVSFSDHRAFSADLGNGWYQVTLVARKTSSETTLTARIYLATSTSTIVYNGNGSGNIAAWRATLATSGVPTRLAQTTSAATTGTSQTGSNLHIRGLPASTSGLLLPGDWFEVSGELKQVKASVNSDASGLAYLQFDPQLVRSPGDNTPVILNEPMGKFLVSNIKIANDFGTQARVSYDLEHIYE